MQSNKQFESFNSGILDIFQIKKNEIIKEVAAGIRFQDKTIGVSRYYEAKVASSRVDRLVSIQMIDNVDQGNLVMIENIQYMIGQIQYKYDTMPPTLWLSLERVVLIKRGTNE